MLIEQPNTGSRHGHEPYHEGATLAEVGGDSGQKARQHLTLLAPDAERRQLTVMFCDLVGSTSLSTELDPEDLREVVQAYQAACTKIIASYAGYVAQYLGDGILAYFGYPEAHEDEAQRGIRAGLEILDAISRITIAGKPLRVRIGIHTGLVVMGGMGSSEKQEQLAIGETPNFAARVQGLAEPGTLVISEATCRLAAGYFLYKSLGEKPLKGISKPACLYQVLGLSGARSRMEAANGLSVFVGRQKEVALLKACWQETLAREVNSILVRGEAGMGKSRLLEILKVDGLNTNYELFECRCSPYFTNTALLPVVESLERKLQFDRDTDVKEKQQRLEAFLSDDAVKFPKIVSLFGSLLSIPIDKYPPLDLSAPRQRQLTLETLAHWLVHHAERQPILAVFEDLHWADPSTLELVSLLLDRESDAPLMLFLTSRPENRSPWMSHSRLTEIGLKPLSRRETARLLKHLSGGKSLPDEFSSQVLKRTGGVPLFVEEVIKAILESDLLEEKQDRYELKFALPSVPIPTTVHDSLMARIDRLGASKPVLQLAAMFGREFSYELLQAVAPREDAALQRDLLRLVDAELIFQRGTPPESFYTFKHALIQDAAYESLLRKTRQAYHRQIAKTVVEQFTEKAEKQPEFLARHYEGAALPLEAIRYWQKAGEQALNRSANQEAIVHFRRGLALLDAIPDRIERLQQELVLQMGLAPALMAILGWAAQEVWVASSRAKELAEELKDRERLVPALWFLWTNHFVRGNLPAAIAIAEQTFELARQKDNQLLQIAGRHAMGFTEFFRGNLTAAKYHAEQGVALFELDLEKELVKVFQLSSTVTNWAYLSSSEWILGSPERGKAAAENAAHLMKVLENFPSSAQGQGIAIYFYICSRDSKRVLEISERLLSLSADERFYLWKALAHVYHGWAVARLGEPEKGLAEIDQGMELYKSIGAGLTYVFQAALRAEACQLAGRWQDALAIIQSGKEYAESWDEHLFESELYRIAGEVQMASGDEAAGEASLKEAITLAHKQGARSLELRAALSLARHGRSAEPLEAIMTVLEGDAPTTEYYEAAAYLNNNLALR